MDEHLRLVGEAAEGGGMDDAVAVALERRARRRLRLGEEAAARGRGVGGERGAQRLGSAALLEGLIYSGIAT
jgi:hypothetical protein